MYIQKYKTIKYILLLSLFFLSCSSKSSDTLLNDIAQIDYNYAHTLLTVKKMDRESSIDVISKFMKDWAVFRKYYFNINEEDYRWKNDINTISDLLIRVDYFVSDDEDISAGYLILHDVKHVLSDIRRRNNIDWPMDYLTSIYKTTYRLNELSKIYSEKNNILQEDSNRIVSVYMSLDSSSQELLEKMKKNTFEFYQFTNIDKETLYQEIVKMDKLIIDMGIYFSDGNYNEIHKQTAKILDKYYAIINLYSLHAREFK